MKLGKAIESAELRFIGIKGLIQEVHLQWPEMKKDQLAGQISKEKNAWGSDYDCLTG